MLLRVPKNAGGAQINTAAVTAAITGTTVMLEYHPDAYIKFIILEGTGRIFRNDRVGESVLLHAGQMLIVNPKGKGVARSGRCGSGSSDENLRSFDHATSLRSRAPT